MTISSTVKRKHRSVEERRRIVEQSLGAGVSVANVARSHGIRSNQVFYWRKLYREGQLGSRTDVQLVPVKVANDRSVETVKEDDFLPRSGTLKIKLLKGTLRVAGNVDVVVLRTAIECLVG